MIALVAQFATANRVPANQIHEGKRQALEDFARLVEDERTGAPACEDEHEKQVINKLYAGIGRLGTRLAWLKKNPASNLSTAKRQALR